MRYYIAYGSNLNLEQMAYRCPTARLISTGLLRGWRLVYRGSKTGAYATIIKDESSEVPVGIFKITDEDERALDIYEGYPRFYRKADVRLNIEGNPEDAMVYIMNGHNVGEPSDYYIRTVRQGYHDCHLPIHYFDESLQFNRSELS